MADDWVDKYLASQSEKSQDHEVSLRRSLLVDSGASPFFDGLYRRVLKDFGTYQSVAKDLHLAILRQENRFSIARNAYPMPKLEVWSNSPTIYYTFSCRVDRSQEDFPEGDTRQIALVSDLSGNIQARGNGKLFKDFPEISEFLLTPVFDCIRIHLA